MKHKRPIILAGILISLIIFNYCFKFGVVDGVSMDPTLKDRQLVFVRRVIINSDFNTGSVVEAVDNEGFVVFKRVKWIKDGKVFLEGDNKPASVDSRKLGAVDISQVKGIVIGDL